jgi:hypothetical protein
MLGESGFPPEAPFLNSPDAMFNPDLSGATSPVSGIPLAEEATFTPLTAHAVDEQSAVESVFKFSAPVAPYLPSADTNNIWCVSVEIDSNRILVSFCDTGLRWVFVFFCSFVFCFLSHSLLVLIDEQGQQRAGVAAGRGLGPHPRARPLFQRVGSTAAAGPVGLGLGQHYLCPQMSFPVVWPYDWLFSKKKISGAYAFCLKSFPGLL